MARRRSTCLILLLGLALVACGPATPQVATPAATMAAPQPTIAAEPTAGLPVSPLPTPEPFTSPLPSPDAPPSPQPEMERAPLSLVVLHSNDNWGETEPCG